MEQEPSSNQSTEQERHMSGKESMERTCSLEEAKAEIERAQEHLAMLRDELQYYDPESQRYAELQAEIEDAKEWFRDAQEGDLTVGPA